MQKSLNETFIPKQLIKKSELSNQNTILLKNSFEKVASNIYLEILPPQVKFAGYELDKVQTANVKIINKAPIPQRIHVLPPTEGYFKIKMNKKGSIPSGMYQVIQVSFKSNEYKYHYDCIKINSETDNFVVPLYAYPTIPNLQQIFPKIIDFGSIQVNQTNSNLYPIQNPVPLDFSFEFEYIKECQQIMITPLKGVIPAKQNIVIQISFLPQIKKTYTAEVLLKVKQFDFQPIHLKIMGNGIDSQKKTTKRGFSAKRIRSSKLAPLKQKQTIPPQIQQPNLLSKTQNQMPSKRTFTRTSYPKLLLNTKKSNVMQNSMAKTIDIRKVQEKQYLSKFNRVMQLDKEKQIKFCQYLGDRPFSEEDLQFNTKIRQQFQKARMEVVRSCTNRYLTDLGTNVEVQYRILQPQDLKYNNNRNDELKARRMKLDKFVSLGTRIIIKYRLTKRLGKIKAFIKNLNKDEVQKKIQQSYAKSLEAGYQNNGKPLFQFQFTKRSITPQSFSLCFPEDNDKQKLNVTFTPQGKTNFDDLSTLDEIQQHQTEFMNYANVNYPVDFVNLDKQIPKNRSSAQQQYALRGPSLPKFKLLKASSVYQLPLKIPNHHFIYDNLEVRRYKNYQPLDQKSSDYLLENTKPVEDEFQGWAGGQLQVLKAKFMRNPGFQFTSFSSYNGTGYNNDIGFFGKIDKNIKDPIQPHEKAINQDMLEEADSDQQKNPVLSPLTGKQLIDIVESKDSKIQQRRNNEKLVNQQAEILQTVNKNLMTIKESYRVQWVNKAVDFNKWSNADNQKIWI